MRKSREEEAHCRSSPREDPFSLGSRETESTFFWEVFFFFLPSNSFVNEGADGCNAVRCNDGSVLCLMTPNLMPLSASHSNSLHVPQRYISSSPPSLGSHSAELRISYVSGGGESPLCGMTLMLAPPELLLT